MSKVVSKEGYVVDHKKWENIKFSIDVKPIEFASKMRELLRFRTALSTIWLATDEFETKGLIETEIDTINEKLKKILLIN